MTDDYYHFEERQMALIGERLAKFRIGDTVKVKVTHVDVDERMIDFQIVGMPISQSSSQRPARGKPFKLKHAAKLWTNQKRWQRRKI